MKITINLLLSLLLSSSLLIAQSEVHSEVRIYLSGEETMDKLIQSGIDIDHYSKNEKNSIDATLSTADIDKLSAHNISYKIIVDDVRAEFVKNSQNNTSGSRAGGICGLDNLKYGSMGHYHTFQEVIDQLDSMKLLYPALISAKDSVGNSIDNRAIYAVKISDNPTLDESATEGTTYFDALHHAREPMSMEALLYCMWWLLENYGTDAEATYLVDHREIHFIPVVNPDGYVYNEIIDPNGGGLWRKNRRRNSASYGVDLNRNYSSSFGNSIGASSNPASNSYHGTSAFSEPETQAVRDYVKKIKPSIAFSCHSYGQKFLIAPGCKLPNEDYESYAEFSSEFINNTFDGFGTTFEMLNYTSCGTTRHFMHDDGIYTLTPEIGSSFWPPQSEYCSTVQNFLGAMKYISHVSGSAPKLYEFVVLNSGGVKPGDTLKIRTRIKNRGLELEATNVSIEMTSTSTNVTPIVDVQNEAKIGPRSFATHEFSFLVNPNAKSGDLLSLSVSVTEDGFETSIKEKSIRIGETTTLFTDNGEQGMTNWSASSWDTTFIESQSGKFAFSDSRYGNYSKSSNEVINLKNDVDLTNATKPYATFNTKRSFESFDNVHFQISTNGTNWNTLATYTNHEHWTKKEIDLDQYIGRKIKIRFELTSDAGVQSDGFYFDDFEVVDFTFKEEEKEPVSLAEFVQLTNVQIYPNPASGEIQINIGRQETVSIKVFHCSGKEVLTQLLTDQITSVNTEELASGLYFVELSAGERTETRKLVIR